MSNPYPPKKFPLRFWLRLHWIYRLIGKTDIIIILNFPIQDYIIPLFIQNVLNCLSGNMYNIFHISQYFLLGVYSCYSYKWDIFPITFFSLVISGIQEDVDLSYMEPFTSLLLILISVSFVALDYLNRQSYCLHIIIFVSFLALISFVYFFYIG